MYNFRFEAVKYYPHNIQTILACSKSFVSVSLVLDVTKIATIRHNYSLVSHISRFWKHVDLDVHLVGYPEEEKNSRFVNTWTVSTLPYRERFVEFSSAYALRWNKVIDCRDRIGRMGRLCKWLTVLVDLPTDCSRRLLLHEYNVYLLICFVKSMATHFSHNCHKIGMTGLLGGK